MPQFTALGVKQNAALLNLIETFAKAKHATPAQLSLAWLLAKKPYLVPIPGSKKLARIQENSEAVNIRLTDQEVKQIDDALEHMQMSEVFGGHKGKR